MPEAFELVKIQVQLPGPLPARRACRPEGRAYRPTGRAYSSERGVIEVITFTSSVQVSAIL